MGFGKQRTIDLHNIDLFHEANIYLPTRTIYFGGQPYSEDEVDSVTVAQVIKNLQILEHQNQGQPITLVLNSCGGSVYDGLAIYDVIKSLKSPVIIIGLGKVMSMGSVLLQAGDLRVLGKNTTVLCHYGHEAYQGHPKDVQAWVKSGKELDKEVFKIYLEKMSKVNSKLTLSHVEKMFEHDTIFNAENAVKLGLADKIMDAVTKEFTDDMPA